MPCIIYLLKQQYNKEHQKFHKADVRMLREQDRKWILLLSNPGGAFAGRTLRHCFLQDGEFDLYSIKNLSYEEGREELVKIRGVGNKIADCVLLFAFGKLESFPVDTHIEQIMERYYSENLKDVKKSRKRDAIADSARRYFGKYCGYAQEYLYLEDQEK
jgi:hypothetical protein